MSKIHDYELTTWHEYSVLCDECGLNESTRDGNRDLALRNAIAEGFRKVNADILCPSCLAKKGEKP